MEPSSKHGRLRRGGRILLAATIGLGAGVLIVKNAFIRIYASGSPTSVLRVLPGNPIALTAWAAGKAPKVQIKALDRVAREAPLLHQPLLAHARLAAQQGRDQQAIELARGARRLQPRSVDVLRLLFVEYLRTGRVDDAVSVAQPLTALDQRQKADVARIFVLLAQDSKFAPAVALGLRRNPPWRSPFLTFAIRSPEMFDFVFHTLASPLASQSVERTNRERSTLLSAMINDRDYRRAYLAWIDFLPPQQLSRVAPIYDGSFTGEPGPRPFNWTLERNSDATAERVTDSTLPGATALRISYSGQNDTAIASQILMVPPGRYAFFATGRASAEGALAGSLIWQLQCLPAGPVIELARYSTFPTGAFQTRNTALVPSRDCLAQKLTLRAVRGDIATPISAEFTNLSLKPQ